MVADVQRMQEEVKRHFAHQKAENSRLQQQVACRGCFVPIIDL